MKYGLGDSYENVSILPEKWRAYLDVSKPASTIGVAGSFIVLSILHFYLQGTPSAVETNLGTIIFASVIVAFSHGASQAMNMAEDAEMDRQTPHKQNRPIPSGIITEEEARTISWILAGLSLGWSYAINVPFGIMVSIGVAFGIFYNLDPIRAKERKISIPWQAASRGFIVPPTVWATFGDVTSPTPWVFGIFMFLYVLAFQNTADIIDRKVDEEFGITTWVVEYGVDTVVTIAAGCTFLMMGVIVGSYYLGLIPSTLLVLILIIPYCGLMLYHMKIHPHMIDENTGNHPAWLWFYVGMVLSFFLPLTAELGGHYL